MKAKIVGRFLTGILVFVSMQAVSNEPVRLALNWKAEPQFGGYYAAQILGHFKKAGFDVEILQGGSGTPVVQAVANGQAQFGVVTGDEIPVAQENGFDVVGLFAAYQTFPQGIMVHESHAAQSLEALLSGPGLLLWQKSVPYAQFLTKKLGSRIKIRQAPYTGGIAAFAKDKAVAQQCFVTSEPLVAKAQGLATRVFMVADLGYNPYASVLIVERQRLSLGVTKRFVETVRKGWVDYMKNPAPIHAAMNSLNPSMSVKDMDESELAQRRLVEHSPVGAMTLSRWEELHRALVSIQAIQGKRTPTDYFRGSL